MGYNTRWSNQKPLIWIVAAPLRVHCTADKAYRYLALRARNEGTVAQSAQGDTVLNLQPNTCWSALECFKPFLTRSLCHIREECGPISMLEVPQRSTSHKASLHPIPAHPRNFKMALDPKIIVFAVLFFGFAVHGHSFENRGEILITTSLRVESYKPSVNE